MEENQVQAAVRRRLGLRVGPEMAAYLLRQLEQPREQESIPVIAGDARIGLPVRTDLPADALRAALRPDEPAAGVPANPS